MGRIINSITKQGTNQFTGAMFNYYTSDAMTAADFFVANSDTLVKPEANKKEWGGDNRRAGHPRQGPLLL